MHIAKLTLAAAVLLAATSAAHAAAPGFAVTDRIAGPDGGWDLASVDPVAHLLYVARSTGVMRIDLATGKVTSDVVPLQRGHGALAIPGTDRAIATSGASGKAILFQGSTGKVIAEIAVGKNPDAIAFDPATRTVWVMNPGSGDASVIAPDSGKVLATVPIGGSLELGVADGHGRLYVNVEDKNDIAVIDTRARKLIKRLPLAGCDGPTGIAYSAKARLLVSACANGVAKVTGVDGHDAGEVKIGGHPDGAVFDDARDVALVPTGSDGRLNAIRLTPAPEVVERAETQTGARTLAFDSASETVYLPAAQYAPALAGARPQAVPGTFTVLVVKPASASSR